MNRPSKRKLGTIALVWIATKFLGVSSVRASDPTWSNTPINGTNFGAEVCVALNPSTFKDWILGCHVPNGSTICPATAGVGAFINSTSTWVTPTNKTLSIQFPCPGNCNPCSGYTAGTVSDPAVAWDHNGNAYFAAIGATTCAGLDFLEWRSTDKGSTWGVSETGNLDSTASSVINDGYSSSSDKPFIVFDQRTSGSYAGQQYAAYVDSGASNIYVKYLKATNGVSNWGSGANHSWQGPASFGTGGSNGSAFPSIAIGPNGEVYVIFVGIQTVTASPILYLTRSTDGGATFASPVAIHNYVGGKNSGNPNLLYMPPWPPSITVATTGVNSGTVYVSFDDTLAAANDWDIYVIHSTTSWSTFSSPVRVNDDQACTGRQQNYSKIVSGNNDSWLSVFWYDMRADSTGTYAYYYCAQSSDGGATFGKNIRVSDSTAAFPCYNFNPGSGNCTKCSQTNHNAYPGEYEGGAVCTGSNGSLIAAWSDNRGGTTSTTTTVQTQQLPDPIPQIKSISPSYGVASGTLSITISGVNMTPDGSHGPSSIVFSNCGITGTIGTSTSTTVPVTLAFPGAGSDCCAPPVGDYNFNLVYGGSPQYCPGTVKSDNVHFSVVASGTTLTSTPTATVMPNCSQTQTYTVTKTPTVTPTCATGCGAPVFATPTPPGSSNGPFPNPAASGSFVSFSWSTITASSQQSSPEMVILKLFSLDGRQISETRMELDSTRLSLAGIARGIYLWVAETPERKRLASGTLAVVSQDRRFLGGSPGGS